MFTPRSARARKHFPSAPGLSSIVTVNSFTFGMRLRDEMREVFTGYRWAPIALDMLDNQFRALFVTQPGTLARIVHGVRQISSEHDLHPESNLLTNPERSSQHTHVGVNTH